LTWQDPATNEIAKGFKESGYLPEALINFLAFLGWNPGTTQELFSMEELIQSFSIERINKAGAKFDIQKAQWFNQQYLRAKTDEQLAEYLLEAVSKESIDCTKEKAIKICSIMRERITFPNDLLEQGRFFFMAPASYDESVISKKWNDEAVKVLSVYKDSLSALPSVDAATAKSTLESVAAGLGIGTGKILQALRVSITGLGSGPDLMVTIEILGTRDSSDRIANALQRLSVKTT
jgi:glutamyl-tRNA synthetase